MKVGKAFRPHTLVVMGDFADFYTVSAHSKDPRRAGQLPEEVASVHAGLDDLDALGAKEKIYLGGNHEDRLRRYLQDKAPELFDVVDIPRLFRLGERAWRYVPYQSDTRLGKLYLTHDVGNAGRYSTYKALDTYQHSVVTGHAHRLSYVVEGNTAGEFKVSAQFGWLGDLKHIDYLQAVNARKNWALGFGIGYLDPTNKLVYLTPIPIVHYTCVVEGRLFR